jgi:transposase
LTKHWSTYLREEISALGRTLSGMAERLRAAEDDASKWLARFKGSERSRIETERLLAAALQGKTLLSAELQRQQAVTAEHGKLLDELKRVRGELKRERAKSRRLERTLNRRTGKEGYFGAATPSSLKIDKANATPENKLKKGGAKPGHKGHGRKGFSADEADETVRLDGTPPPCGCGGAWEPGLWTEHCVEERIPERRLRRFFLKRVYDCSKCGRHEELSTPGVIPGGLYGNALVAHAMSEHYLHGLSAGAVSRREGLNEGTLFGMAHRSAKLLGPSFDRLRAILRTCLVLHADETSWRNDGSKAYAWLFANSSVAVFLFRATRGSVVPKELFGKAPLELNLVTDRYAGYNKLPVWRQYCYVHLLRDLKEIEADFPDDTEVAAFTAALKPLLAGAIGLRSQGLELADYLIQAVKLQTLIMDAAGREANHPAIQGFQNIFREHPERLFQWVKSPDIPAENNFAERNLRPTVIARKLSFGSQSDKGMQTREVLMSFLHTARLRGLDPEAALKDALDILSRDPTADVLPIFGFKPESPEQPSAVA